MTHFLLHHETAGSPHAPPLVMVGSLGTTLAMWDPQVPPLAARHRTIRVDLRGHGRSPVPNGPYAIAELAGDVLLTLDELGVEHASYCGLSIGGMIGMWLAVHAPRRIDRLVLICSSARVEGSTYGRRAEMVRAAGTTAVIADEVLPRWFTSDWAVKHAELVGRHRAMILATPAEGYAGCCEAVAGFDVRGVLEQIMAPTLVIAGADDAATPPAHSRAIADEVPRAHLEVLDNAAHLASVQRPAAVTELIAEHLDTAEEA